MRKVMFIFLCFVGVMVFASYALATTTYTQWNGTGAGVGNWNDSTWTVGWAHVATDSGGVMGNPNYKAGFKTNAYPDLSSGTYSCDILVFGGANASRLNNLVLSGATINVSEYVTLAAAATDNGIVTVNGGVLNTGVNYNNGQFYVTQLGNGLLNMNDGIINVGTTYSGNLSMTGTGVTSVGTLNLDGGYIYANDLLKGSGTANLVITDGMLVLKTNRQTEIAGYVSAGWITTTNLGGTIMTSYDAGRNQTTVWATPEPATVCLLGLGAMALVRRNKK
jgi:hypothetical protein